MRRDRVRPVLLLLLAASVNYNLAAFRRPAHTFGSSLLKVEKPFRALLEGDPVLVPPTWMFSQSSSLHSAPSLPIRVCSLGCLWHLPLLFPTVYPTCWPQLPLRLCQLCMDPSAGLSLQALWAHRHLIFAFFDFPPTSFYSPSPLPPPTHTEGKYFKVVETQSMCLCWNFEMSNIYLNKVSHDLGITAKGLFCFYNICHKKPVFTVNGFKTSRIFFKNANKVSECWGLQSASRFLSIL